MTVPYRMTYGVSISTLIKPRKDFIEYTALINIRPHLGNNSMVVEDPAVRRARLSQIIDSLVDYAA